MRNNRISELTAAQQFNHDILHITCLYIPLPITSIFPNHQTRLIRRLISFNVAGDRVGLYISSLLVFIRSYTKEHCAPALHPVLHPRRTMPQRCISAEWHGIKMPTRRSVPSILKLPRNSSSFKNPPRNLPSPINNHKRPTMETAIQQPRRR